MDKIKKLVSCKIYIIGDEVSAILDLYILSINFNFVISFIRIPW